LWDTPKDKLNWYSILEKAREIEEQNMIMFHKWMKDNDTPENAERFFHFTDEDMLNQYHKESSIIK
jgi:hypothetical protein